MRRQQSKDELLYRQVNCGNVEGIKALRGQGAGLEWIDSEGKTPLIAACMIAELFIVAKTLIELGANVNAYQPGRHSGTPLHHAAKRGLERTVALLLTYGANALVENDDCQTPLDVARVKGYNNVVRAIEHHICLFSGWLRELYRSAFLGVIKTQRQSRRVWVVVLPCESRNGAEPLRFELAIYSSSQDAKPHTLIALWEATIKEPNFNQSNPVVIISDSSSEKRIKLACGVESSRQQLKQFCHACKGISQVIRVRVWSPRYPTNTQAPIVPATAPSTAEDVELARAINASIQSAMEARPLDADGNTSSGANVSSSSHNGWATSAAAAPPKGSCNGWEIEEVVSPGNPTQHIDNQSGIPAVVQTTETPVHASFPSPSAPPIDNLADDGPIYYPSIDSSPIDLSSPLPDSLPARADEKKEETSSSSSCVICLDAPVEGACIPCGHMAGCMSCLNEIKAKKWGCPVCRTRIAQVLRLYAVS